MVKSFRKGIKTTLHFVAFVFILASSMSCGIKKAQKNLLSSTSLKGAHIGTAVYNESKSTWVDQYQSNLNYTPASNTKILSCYLGMKYLGDSIPGWQFAENADSIFLMPLGDPTFLHPDFSYQPIASLIKNTPKQVVLCLPEKEDQFEMYGRGWAWDDYAEDYQPERNRLNIYGNVLTITKTQNGVNFQPSFFVKNQARSDVYKQWYRQKRSNQFFATNANTSDQSHQIPFITDNHFELAKTLIEDTLHPKHPIAIQRGWNQSYKSIFKTVPTDSLLKIMMNRSDNFFAEQILLMASEQHIGKMDDRAIIDTILKTDFSFFPQKTQWADGSGLSRFNLITPENYVALLQKMKAEFPFERIKNIFAQGGKGTLSAYYKNIPGVLYAKTGTLGNQIALSGYIITNKGTHLTFSVLVANHMAKSYDVRKSVEQYLTSIMSKY